MTEKNQSRSTYLAADLDAKVWRDAILEERSRSNMIAIALERYMAGQTRPEEPLPYWLS